MTLLDFIFKSIRAHAFRSGAVVTCVLLATGFATFSALVIRGSEYSLQLGLARLGADLLVVPAGTEAKVESALLVGKPATAWMPSQTLDRVANTPGVAVASPQLFLASLRDASCCAVSEMFLVAYDPRTDFTIRPWLERSLGQPLAIGEAVGGNYVFLPAGDDYLKLYGYPLALKGNLEATGTGLDQTLFFTFETARAVAEASLTRAEKPLAIPPDSISAILVTLRPGADAHAVALAIAQANPGVSAVESPGLFRTYRGQLVALTKAFMATLGAIWSLCVLLVGLLFAVAVDGRRRELGVLRALGSSRRFIVSAVLGEATLLALAGAVPGIALAAFAGALFRPLVVTVLGIPLLPPALPDYLELVTAVLGLAVASVAAAALWPALRASRLEPATAMR